MGFRSRVAFSFVTPIIMGVGIGCALPYSEPSDPIAITPVAYQTQPLAQEASPPLTSPTPTRTAAATPTPTPWPAAKVTPSPRSTATLTPAFTPTTAPTHTSRSIRTPVPTISKWAQVQRDYRDRRITYDQAVEEAIEAGLSRPQARIALAQIRIP